VSDDIEALLRSGMVERVDAAPVFDDPGLAEAAIAGAGRIRRRRRIASAASGAGLLVLGAAAFVWQPWAAPDVTEDDGVTAADTSTEEAQNELDMEFVVEGDNGVYEIINQNGDSLAIGDREPSNVYRLDDAYLSESANEVWTTSFDGDSGMSFEKQSTDETYLRINTVGEQFAMITPTANYTTEEYSLVDVTMADPSTGEAGDTGEPAVAFSVSYDLSLIDWTAATAVFSADLYTTTGGNSGPYMFNEEFDWGLESVAAAGFESVVIADASDPNYLCVEDLDAGVGVTSTQEVCGQADSTEVEEYLAVASGGASDPVDISATVLEEQTGEMYPAEETDLGEYQSRFDESEFWWTDPLGRWQVTASEGDRTWLLLDTSDGEPRATELEIPPGAIMPVLSYT
jgi:hypothetical protein